MKNVLLIIKKEFNRFFKDRRMILMLFLPGLLIFCLYSLIGTVMEKAAPTIPEGYKPTVYFCRLPDGFLSENDLKLLEGKDFETLEEAKSNVAEGTLDIVVEFQANFTAAVEGSSRPEVKVYYNSSVQTSIVGYTLATGILSGHNAFTVNSTPTEKFDLVDEDEQVTNIFAMVIPLLMFSLLASSCISVAPEAIAGEKERGTMATMLITPVKRIEIVLGKILSLSCYAMLSGIISFLGVILSLPKLSGGLLNLGAVSYGVGTYFMLFGLIISIVLVMISAFSVLSTLAKNVKEATAFIGPLMLVIILLGMSSMFFTNPSVGLYAIPFIGSGIAMSAVLSTTASALGVVLAILSNLVLTALLVVLMGFMFKKENIMLKK
ncbi:MAG: ABC transporter permease subunit [Clostridia bacterium]|nr:ABC transporter permease subunit [Clostridia bacterium]